MKIIIDTREQEPYEFKTPSERQVLPAGDYSLDGLIGDVAVERKSVQDLVNTVIGARARFTRELKKLREHKAACVVIEGSMQDILDRRYKGNANPKSVLALVLSITTKWNIPVFWCTNRPLARHTTEEWLRSISKTLKGNK